MPICTVDRKRGGSAARSSATGAPVTARLARVSSRAFREETIAISDRARTPLIIVRRRMMAISTMNIGVRPGCWSVCSGASGCAPRATSGALSGPARRYDDAFEEAAEVVGQIVDMVVVAALELPVLVEDFAGPAGHHENRTHAEHLGHDEVAGEVLEHRRVRRRHPGRRDEAVVGLARRLRQKLGPD